MDRYLIQVAPLQCTSRQHSLAQCASANFACTRTVWHADSVISRPHRARWASNALPARKPASSSHKRCRFPPSPWCKRDREQRPVDRGPNAGQRRSSFVLKHNGARLRIVFDHKRSHVVEEHFLGHTIEGQEGALQAIKPGSVPLSDCRGTPASRGGWSRGQTRAVPGLPSRRDRMPSPRDPRPTPVQARRWCASSIRRPKLSRCAKHDRYDARD
jgi:hypothetical protein